MTDTEEKVDSALCVLGNINGALLVVATADKEDADDYFGLAGQKAAMAGIVKAVMEDLGGVIKSLKEVAPKKDAGGKED